MKDMTCAEVNELFEEADDDLGDAVKLAGRSAPAARYAASQAAEKYLRALCDAADRPAGVMWDIAKVHDTVRDIGGLGDREPDVALLARFTTPARTGDGQTVMMHDVLFAAKMVRWAVRSALGCEEPQPEKPEAAAGGYTSNEVIDSAMIPEDDDMIPTILPGDADSPAAETPTPARHEERGRGRPEPGSGRSPRERETSFVKMFLVCDRCGVRIPRTRQTATGRVPCSMCGRPMKLQK